MNGYEGFRIALQTRLVEEGRSMEDVAQIMDTICMVAQDYTIEKNCTDIVVYQGIPREVDEYLACKLMEGVSPLTVKNYRIRLYDFFMKVRIPYQEITHKEIRAYMLSYQHGREKPICNRTANAYQGVIVRFFGWLQDMGYITANPTKSLPAIKYVKKQKESMNRHDLIVLLDACKNLRQRAIVALAYATGCRVSELCRIKKSDINWVDKSIIVLGKGSKYRTVYFNDQAEIYVKQYLESRKDDNPYLIVSTRGAHSVTTTSIEMMMREIYTKVSDQVNVKVTPHIVRHTTATLAIESGMPVTTVQKLLGHASIETTMEYVDMSKVSVIQEYKKFVV